jgi:hypothetical protein
MDYILQLEIGGVSTHWTPWTIARDDFVAVIANGRRRIGRTVDPNSVFVHSGAFRTIAGEMVGAPVGRPAISGE